MDKRDLFYSCKTGNISRIRYLVEEKDVDLNVIDKWNSTPLYYASLCGHYNVVLYLLKNGATCNANTFEGERCLYGALTDEIRNLLRNVKVITAVTKKRDMFSEFHRKVLGNSEFCDIQLVIEDIKVPAHCVILTARSKYFHQHILGKDAMSLDLTYLKVDPVILKNFLGYLYMVPVYVSPSDAETYAFLPNFFMINDVMPEINNLTTNVLCMQPKSLPQMDYLKLFLSTLPKELRTQDNSEEPQFIDIKIKVEQYVFFCHKVFICGRCCYLQALVTDHFSEALQSTEDNIQLIVLNDIEPNIFVQILKYIYTDTVDLSPENVLIILEHADKYILPGLKKICSSFAEQLLTVENVVSAVKVARLYELSRLEDKCEEYMAKYLEEVINNPDFKELVLADANEIINREEVDTIPIIDDIRYHINNCLQVKNELGKQAIINEFLKHLNLEA